MVYRWLRYSRIAISLFLFVFILFIFIDFSNLIYEQVIATVLYIQFVPSILEFAGLLSLTASGFIIVLLLTLLFGRVYCSFLCPLGTLQDILIRTTRIKKKRKKFTYQKPHHYLRYGILVITLAVSLAGPVILLNLLDPYSLAGKIFSSIVRPLYYVSNNLVTGILESTGLYVASPVGYKTFSLISVVFASFFLTGIAVMVYFRGRLYCNTVCPVGTLLGLTSKISLFRVRLDKALCNSCGLCSVACKAGCIDSKARQVDFSRCIMCFDCMGVCKNSGVKFDFFTKDKLPDKPFVHDENKRQFISRIPVWAAMVPALLDQQFTSGKNDGKKPVIKKYTVIPPGAKSLQHFNANCTACHLCVSQCPTHVLRPSVLQYGFEGIMQPFMDYHASYCNFECTICGQVCPTNAITELARPVKQLTQLGKSFFIKENCVVYTNETACGACSEHCPTKAVQMVPYKGSLKIPEVTNDICIGCGACEYACPTDPKSIYVDGNPVHVFAKKPVDKEKVKELKKEDDFPF